jgi:hypothetical protein
MYLKDELIKLGDKKIRIYLDMDGTIVHYDVGVADNYDVKRPLFNRINNIKEIINTMKNIEFYILSIGNEPIHVEQKNKWLDKFLPEIIKENRNILIRNKNSQITSASIKKDYINSLKTDDIIVIIDDDPRVLGALYKDNRNNAILYKDSVLSD